MKKICTLSLFLLFTLAACHRKNTQPILQSNSPSSLSDNLQKNWKQYHNDEYGISFAYPSDWHMEAYEKSEGVWGFTLLTVESQETKKRIDDFKMHPYDGHGPGSSDLTFDIYPDFVGTQFLNTHFQVPVSQNKPYKSAADFFSEASNKGISVQSRMIAGVTAFETLDENYVLLIEHRNNLLVFKPFFFSLEGGVWLSPDSIEEKIFQTIQLY